MKKLLSLFLALALIFSFAACGSKEKDDADEKSSFQKVFNYIKKEGSEYDGSYMLTKEYSDSDSSGTNTISIVAVPADANEDENVDSIDIFIQTNSENGKYSVLYTLKEDEKTASVSMSCEIIGSEYYNFADIDISTFDADNPTLSDFSTDAPSSLRDTMKTLLGTYVTLSLYYVDDVLDDGGFSVKDLGFKSLTYN